MKLCYLLNNSVTFDVTDIMLMTQCASISSLLSQSQHAIGFIWRHACWGIYMVRSLLLIVYTFRADDIWTV